MFQVLHRVEHTNSCSSPSVLGHSQVSPYGDLGIASFCVSLASIFFTWARFEHNCRVYLDIASMAYKYHTSFLYAKVSQHGIQVSYNYPTSFFLYASLFDHFMDMHLQVLCTHVLTHCLFGDVFSVALCSWA